MSFAFFAKILFFFLFFLFNHHHITWEAPKVTHQARIPVITTTTERRKEEKRNLSKKRKRHINNNTLVKHWFPLSFYCLVLRCNLVLFSEMSASHKITYVPRSKDKRSRNPNLRFKLVNDVVNLVVLVCG